MKRLVVAAVIVIVAVGAALAAVPFVEKHAAARIKTEIERDGNTTVGAVEVGLLQRRVLLTDLQSRQFGEIAVGRWQASGLAWPLGELIMGRTPLAGVRLGDPLQADRVELSDVRAVGEGSTWSVGSLVIDGFDLGRYDPPPAGSADPLFHLGARIAAALSIARMEQKDTIAIDAKGDKVAIGSVSLAGIDKGLVASSAAAGFEVTPRNAKAPFVRIADAKLTKLDLRRAFTTMSQVEWQPGMPIGRLDLDALSATGFGGEALTRYGISLGSITSEIKREGQDVKRSSLRIQGFVLSPPLRGLETLQLRIGLQAMGLQDLRLDLACAGTEDRAKAEVSIDRCALTGAELGEIDLAARLVGTDAAFWQAVDDGEMFALLRTKAGLGSARLVVVDRGLVERSIRAMATTSGQPVAAVRSGIAREVRRFQPPGVLITEALTSLLDTVARFVETGGTLTLTAKPDTPIGIDKLDYFQRPGPDLVETLGLGATLSR